MVDVKKLRKQLSLTQEKMAQQLDVTTLTIRRWEKGQGQMHFGNKKRLEHLAKQVWEQTKDRR